MFKLFNLLLFLCAVIKSSKCIIQVWTYSKFICDDNHNIVANVYSYTPYYNVVITQGLKAFTEIKAKFDSEGTIVLVSIIFMSDALEAQLYLVLTYVFNEKRLICSAKSSLKIKKISGKLIKVN